MANVLWVEQPVGTGYSQGTPSINVRFSLISITVPRLNHLQNEDELSAQLVGFIQQFLDVFQELKGIKLYLTGESVCYPSKLSK